MAVILSEAKDLLSLRPTRQQILRFVQDDSMSIELRTEN
jgi:hypothetical protein